MGKRENTYLNRGQCLFMPHLRKNASFRVCIPWRGRGSWAGATGARTGRMSHSAALSLSLSRPRALCLSRAPRAAHSSHQSPHKPFLHSGEALTCLGTLGVWHGHAQPLTTVCARPSRLFAGWSCARASRSSPAARRLLGSKGGQRGTLCPQFGVGLCASSQRGIVYKKRKSIRSLSSLRDQLESRERPHDSRE